MDAFFRRYTKDMKGFCDAGMKLPDGVSAEVLLGKMENLLLTVNEFLGPEEFTNQRKDFSIHVQKFANHYKLQLKKISLVKEQQPCASGQQK